MRLGRGPFVCVLLLGSCVLANAQEPAGEKSQARTWLAHCERYREKAAEKYGTYVDLLVTYQGQLSLNGQKREGKGKSSFSYQVGLTQRLWKDAELYIEAKGGSGRGLDPILGSVLGVNDDAGQPRCLYVNKAYLSQSLFDEKVQMAAGKVDMTDFFDGNEVANCEDFQFLSSSLVNDPAIPFPSEGIGVVVRFAPVEWFYVMAGVADAQAVETEMGTNTAFHDEDYSFSAYEFGFTPKIAGRQGNYRFLLWYDPQPVDQINGSGVKRDDAGFALSFDQEITDRVTLFFRYGFGHEQVRDIEHFWSLGGQLAEPLPGRKDDVLGLAVAQAVLGKDYRDANAAAHTETLLELYYRLQLNEQFTVGPHLQVIVNPAANSSNDCAVVGGIRAVFSF